MQPLMPILLDASLKGLMVLALAWLAVALMRRRSAAARHMVWAGAVVAVLLMPLLASVTPGFNVLPGVLSVSTTALPETLSSTVPSTLPEQARGGAADRDTAEAQTATAASHPDDTTRALLEMELAYVGQDDPMPAGHNVAASSPATSADAAPGWLSPHPWLTRLWLTGAALALLPLVLGWLSLWRLKRNAEPITAGSWHRLLNDLAMQLRLHRRVVLLKSPCRTMPMTWGALPWVSATVLLPDDACQWPAERRRAVLLHELAHVKRRDCSTQLLTGLACAVYWFNPLLWLAAHRMLIERERACDDLVLTHQTRPSDYAEHLLDIAAGSHTALAAHAPGSPAIAMARRSHLHGRLAAILDQHRNRRAMSRVGIVMTITLVGAAATLVACMQPADHAADTTFDVQADVQAEAQADVQADAQTDAQTAEAEPTTRPEPTVVREDASTTGPYAPLLANALRADWDASWQNTSIRAGWPVALPGEVRGSPVAADVTGDGQLELVVPVMYSGDRFTSNPPMVHSQPAIEALLYAFDLDGRLVPGWPVVISDREAREHDRETRPMYSEYWATSPSVADVTGDGRDELLLNVPSNVRVLAVSGDGEIMWTVGGGEAWSSIPVVDIDGNGELDVMANQVVVRAATGEPVPGWAPPEDRRGGFAPAVGDASGDGQLEFYYPTHVNPGLVVGHDRFGDPLPGWPQQVGRQSLYQVVIGDITGDGYKEVVATDQHGYIHAWTWDGQPLASTFPRPPHTSVFKENVGGSGATPSLADLTGDGRAEIVIFCTRDNAIKAWRSDGTSVTGQPDGIVARLHDAQTRGGVSVADLDNDGVMDFFVATWWVRLHPDGQTESINMLPEHAHSSTQPSIVDLTGDGNAEILFGLTDGRVFVYETGKRVEPEWIQWQTNNGDFRHRGAWPLR